MKYSKLMLSLLATSVFTIASASTDTNAVSCSLGTEICSFPGEGAIVYFDNLTPGQYVCALSNNQDQDLDGVVVKINEGKDAVFHPQALHIGSPILLDVKVKGAKQGNVGQIKGHLIMQNGQNPAAFGLQCAKIGA